MCIRDSAGAGAASVSARRTRAPRSILPLTIRGSSSISVMEVGTIAGGSAALARALISSTVVSTASSQAASAGAPSGPLTTATAVWRTPGSSPSTLSTSPGSTRWPRIFTWSSARPVNSSMPSGRHQTRSPVR